VFQTASENRVSILLMPEHTTFIRSWLLRLLCTALLAAVWSGDAASLTADFDSDGEVGFGDFLLFARGYGVSQGNAQFDARFDLDANGRITFSDFLIFASVYGKPQEDRREDPAYLDAQIKHISDAGFFAALDIDRQGLEAVREAVALNDFDEATREWGEYWAQRQAISYVNKGTPLQTEEDARRHQDGDDVYTTAADRIVAHEIQGPGGITIQHGPVVDFNANYGANSKYDFHYWVWSSPLLRAYLTTEDSTYLDTFETLFNQWYEQRDSIEGAIPDLDVVWNELGLGAFRNRIFLEFYRLARRRVSNRTHARLLKTFLGSGRWLYELQMQGYRSGNWQIMGAYALAEIGLNFPELREASSWVATGVRRMLEHLDRDFYPDGGHSERCPSSYSIIAYRDPRNLAHLLERFGVRGDNAAALVAGLERNLEHWMYLLSPLGTLPAVNDGGRGTFDAGIFLDGGRTFDRPDFSWIGANLLDGDDTGPMAPPVQTSVDLRPSGFAVMREDWSKESPYLVINYGPDGGGHSHADVLSFELFAYGKALAVDAGIGLDYDDPLYRPWYLRSRAHNMLLVDDADIKRWKAKGENPVWSSQERLDYFAAEHKGYEQTKGVWHRRHFVFSKEGDSESDAGPYFLIYDHFDSGDKERLVSFMLHSPTVLEPTWSGAVSSKGPGLMVYSSDAVEFRKGEGTADLRGVSEQGWASIPWISLDTHTPGGEGDLAVLLYPFRLAPPDGVSIYRGGDGAAPGTVYLIVTHGGNVDHIVISDGQMRVFGGGAIYTDARCAFVRTSATQTAIRHAVTGATRLTFEGQSLFSALHPTDSEGDSDQ
jgi:hypothetical protein